MYSAARFTPMKSAKKFLQENVTVFSAMIGDYMRRHKESFAAIAPGEGKIIQHDGHKLAVYKDETEGLKVCSAVCTHFGCIVRWNNDERSWDCPCHGSRFDTDGEVLEGPALHALAKAEMVDDEKILRNPIPTIIDNLGTGLGR
jgi:Rieske Fe-S protein